MKKRVFLKILVALAVLTSVLLTSVLGVSKAEYFKEFMSGALSVEMDPDLMLSYYLYDYNGTGSDATSKTLAPERGSYRSLKNFSQEIVVGQDAYYDSWNGGAEWLSSTAKKWEQVNEDGLGNIKFNGEKIIYQIKLPVDETGYYVLDFTVDFTKKTNDAAGWQAQDKEIFSQNYDRAIGCEILNASDGYEFGKNTRLDLYTRSGNDTVYATSNLFPDGNAKAKNKRLESDGAYQWKTLAPSRMERVKLAFKVEEADVAKGYVLWMWDFAGLYGGKTYKIDFTDVSIEKTMDLPNPTTGKLNTDKPYFMFPQTDIINNQLINGYGDPKASGNNGQGDYINNNKQRTMNDKGKVSYSKGRGAFVTEATANSLQLQAESLAYAWDDNIGAYSTQTNPVGFYVPVKNIKPNVTYKVTFDFSIARQGLPSASLHRNYLTSADLADYAGFDDILKDGENLFSSYLSYVKAGSTIDNYTNRSSEHHKDKPDNGGMAQIQYNDKTYKGAGIPLTKYDDVTRNSLNYFTTQNSVNDTYSTIGEAAIPSTLERAETRNWYNAVLHTEYNGQNKINWMTFYNTTFSFNIPESGANFDQLYWVWAIDATEVTGYYRIRIDNVRIQEVVQYSSVLNMDGVSIAGTDIVPPVHHDENYGGNAGIFSGFRGTNGTGQNYQAKGAVLDKGKYIMTNDKLTAAQKEAQVNTTSQVFMAEGNIYAPIVDASRYTAAPGNGKDYRIELDGYAVCTGGIDRYVFSVDGGLTWENMTLTGANTTSTTAGETELKVASRGVNQHASGTTRYDKPSDFTNTSYYTGDLRYDNLVHLDVEGGVFGANDAKNGKFADGALYVDMSKYKHQANLNIIIAAVPASNTSLRCEIVRIINYNPIRNYYTQAKNVISDITVTNPTKGTASLLNGYYFMDPNSTQATKNMNQSVYENTESFSYMKGIRLSLDEPSNQIASYSRGTAHSYAYEDTRTLFLDIPVYTQLSITGFSFVEKGNTVSITETKASDGTITKRVLKETAISGESIEGYAWSADGGRTWNPCSGTTGETSLNTEAEIADATLDNDIKNRAAAWVNNSKYKDKTYTAIQEMAQAYESYAADNFSKAIRANLSQYAGKTVDVIFAAKPKGSDVYCPIGKIDNVAVCGADKTFYTEIESVQIVNNGTTTTIAPTYSDRSNKPLDKLTKNIVGSNIGWWDLDYAKAADADADFIYTSYEAYNTNIYQTRLYNYNENPISGGSTIKITGATVAAGLTTTVKYSFDGGLTWSTITKGTEAATSAIIDKAKKCDNSLTSGTNGGYTTTPLSIPVPSNISGQARNLLVVIEGDGISYPILSVRLLFP